MATSDRAAILPGICPSHRRSSTPHYSRGRQKHGYAIMKDVADRTDRQVELSTGTLYGIIKRLLADGLIRESALGSTDRRRAYRLTPFGRKVALAEVERMRGLVTAADMTKLLRVPVEG